MKKTIYTLLITLLICTICITGISAAIARYSEYKMSVTSPGAYLPVAFYALAAVVWLCALSSVFYTFIKDRENLLAHVFIAVLFCFLLFVATLAAIFVIYSIREEKKLFEIFAEFIKTLNLNKDDYLGLSAVLLSFGSLCAVIFNIIQAVKRSARIKRKGVFEVLFSILGVFAVIAADEAFYMLLKNVSFFRLRKTFDVVSALVIITGCVIVHNRTKIKRN